MIGKGGIDLKLYDHVRETKVDEKGKLFTDGGEFVRNYYSDSAANVHQIILELASRHISNIPLDRSLLTGHGKSWQDRKGDYIRNLPKSAASEAAAEMIDLYDAISAGDGEDVYLSDGMWMSSDGSVTDRS